MLTVCEKGLRDNGCASTVRLYEREEGLREQTPTNASITERRERLVRAFRWLGTRQTIIQVTVHAQVITCGVTLVAALAGVALEQGFQ